MSAPAGHGARDVLVTTATIDRLVRRLLAGGLVVCAVLLLAGVVVLLVRGGTLPTAVTGPLQGARDMAALRPIGFFSLGLLALILTPFVRVAGSVVVFLRAHDWRYAVITAAVLAIMIAGIWLGTA